MTQPPPLTPDEPARLQALRSLNLVETPLEERFERITRLARKALGVRIAAISLVEADYQWFKSIQGLDASETGRDVSFCGHTILHDEITHVPDAREDPRFATNPLVTGPPHIVLYAGCPIRAENGSKIGTLCVIDPERRTLDDDDLQTLADLAALVEGEMRASAAAAVQAALIDDVTVEQRRALIDAHTRVWNREGILRVAADALDETAKGADGTSLVFVDLDHFKQINDGFGHAAGDEALRECARRMIAVVRDSDAVGRLGGDEFLAVLSPCISAEGARDLGERLRACMADTPVRSGAAEFCMTVSVGVRYLEPGTTCDLEREMDAADKALYRSKTAGRDRVVIADAA